MRTRRTSVILGLSIVATIGCIWYWSSTGGQISRPRVHHRLPEKLRVETISSDLSAQFDPHQVETKTGVRIGGLSPGRPWEPRGRHRHAIIAPPPSTLRFRAHVPESAKLRFAIAVAQPSEPPASAIGVRFVVTIEGERVFARVLNPVDHRDERRWFDSEIDLADWSGREIDIHLSTEADGTPPAAGTPGWSYVRIVREAWRERQPAGAEPNVLFLVVDTLRADHLGCYGANPSPSPVLDALAKKGFVSEEALSQASWTLPSMGTLFTGLHPTSHGLTGQSNRALEASSGGADRSSSAYLSTVLPTLATLAQSAGITTVGVSSTPMVSMATGLSRGFETFADFEWPRSGWPDAEEVNEIFLSWLESNPDLRFFAYLHYMDTHDPYQPPAAYLPTAPEGTRAAVAGGRVTDLPQATTAGSSPLTAAELAHLKTLYDAEIRYWDSQLGVLLDGLEAAGVMESTIVIVTSDHGEEFLEHGRLKHRKTLYDEVIRVPLVLYGPGIRALRLRVATQGIDVLPTIAALLGAEVPFDAPGQNLLAGPEERAAIVSTQWSQRLGGTAGQLIAVRTPRWKLIWNPESGSRELYDLLTDPAEQVNRYGSVPEGDKLAPLLREWQARAPRPPEAAGRHLRFEEMLRALGYIE